MNLLVTCYVVELIVFSMIAFVFYFWDKRAARKGTWRVPEARLHLISMLGGWPGAFFAQRVLHHKSSKSGFTIVTWLIAILHTSLFAGAIYLVWVASA